MQLFFWLFLGLAACFWVGGWVMSARFRNVPVLEPGAPKPPVKISIVIPARDEEENLSRLLPSLVAQEFAPHEIIVVNDQSADRTAEVAAEHGARVIDGRPLPEGWYGKPWACQQGADAATGDWILFLDSDLIMEPEGLLRIGHLARHEDRVHSICPYHRVPTAVEQLSAYFNVIMVLGMNAFTVNGENAEGIGLFGQALFVSRNQYDSVGGHEPVRAEVLENFHLSRFFANAGYQCCCYLGKGTIAMRMFPGGFDDLVAGWSKGFVSGAGNTPRSAVVGISFWLSGLIMSLISLTFLPLASPAVTIAIGIFYLLCVVQCLYLFSHVGSYRVLNSILFPIGLCFYQSVFFRSLIRKKKGGQVQWKGRDVG